MLPKIDVPIFDITLPSTGKKLKARPFLVKEEKLMLMAAQSKETSDIINAIKQIITNCVLDPIEPEKLPLFDIQYILIQLRIRSLGNNLEISYVCQTPLPEKERVPDGPETCNTPFKIKIALDDLEVERSDTKEKKIIQLTGDVGVTLKYPEFQDTFEHELTEFNVDLYRAVVESIYDKDNIYKLSEQTDEEIEEFFDGLSKEQYDKIKEWLESLPSYFVKKSHTCEKCGTVHEIVVDDLANFF